jgi:hypothetical protein
MQRKLVDPSVPRNKHNGASEIELTDENGEMRESGATGSTGGDGDATHGRVPHSTDTAEHREIAEGGGEEADNRKQDDERAILRELDTAGPGSVHSVGQWFLA